MGHGFSNPLFIPTGPSAWTAPVFPLILAGIFRLFGTFSLGSALATLALNCLLSAVTGLPVRGIAKSLFGEPVATYCAWAWALFPYSIYFAATVFWDTSLSTLLLTCLVWMTLELARRNSRWWWAAYGALCGASAITNPVLLAPLPLLAAWLIYRRSQSGRKSLLELATAAILFIVTISPWLVRNYQTFHKPFLLKSNLWLEVTTGNLGDHRHWWNDDQHPSRNTGELLEMARVGETRYMAGKKTVALAYIKLHPVDYLQLCLRRFVFVWTGFWSLRQDYLVDEPLDPVNIVFCSTLSIAALFGIRLAWKRAGSKAFPCLAVLLSFPAIYYLTHPFPYYREPMDPELVLFATFALSPVLLHAWNNSWTVQLALRLIASWKPVPQPTPVPEALFVPAELVPVDETAALAAYGEFEESGSRQRHLSATVEIP